MAHKRKFGPPVLFAAVFALGAAFVLAPAFSSPAFSWEGRLPDDFTLIQRRPKTSLDIAWNHTPASLRAEWTYTTPLDIKSAEVRLRPLIEGWPLRSGQNERRYEREPGGPAIHLFSEGDHTLVFARDEKGEPAPLVRWFASLPSDKIGLMPSRTVYIQRD